MLLTGPAIVRSLALVLPIAIFGSFLGCVWTCSEASEESLDHSLATVEAPCSEDCAIESTPGALATKERNDPQSKTSSAELAGATSISELRIVAAAVSIIPISTKHPPPERLCVFRI